MYGVNAPLINIKVPQKTFYFLRQKFRFVVNIMFSSFQVEFSKFGNILVLDILLSASSANSSVPLFIVMSRNIYDHNTWLIVLYYYFVINL